MSLLPAYSIARCYRCKPESWNGGGWRSEDREWLPKWAVIAALGPMTQRAIEKDTFKRLKILSTEIETLEGMISRYEHRADFIKCIEYIIVLPQSNDTLGNKKGEEIRINNLVATEAMSKLLAFLSRLTGRAKFYLTITSGSGESLMKENTDTARYGERRFFGPNWNDITTLHSCLRVPNIQGMPVAPCVSGWSIGTANSHYDYPLNYQFDPQTSFALSTRFPNAKSAEIRFKEVDYFNHHRQEQQRRLIQAVQSFPLPTSTSNLSIHIHSPEMFTSAPAPFLGPREETLASVIHPLLNRFEGFSYRGPVDPSFFWPYLTSENPRPFWPFMTHLVISFDMVSSSGQPLFHSTLQDSISRLVGVKKDPQGMLPPGHGTREESEKASKFLMRARKKSSTAHAMLEMALDSYLHPQNFIYSPGLSKFTRSKGLLDWNSRDRHDHSERNPTMVLEHLTPLLEALGKAAGQMRSLQYLSFQVIPARFEFECSVKYYAPGVSDHWRSTRAEPVEIPRQYPGNIREEFGDYFGWCESLMPIDENRPRVYFDTDQLARWHPGKSVLDLFRVISQQNHGEDARLYSGFHVWDDTFGYGEPYNKLYKVEVL